MRLANTCECYMNEGRCRGIYLYNGHTPKEASRCLYADVELDEGKELPPPYSGMSIENCVFRNMLIRIGRIQLDSFHAQSQEINQNRG